MNDIELWCGDCLELMKNIPDGSVDLILVDPPYGTTACKWDSVIPFEPLWEQLNRIIKNNGTVLIFACGSFEHKVIMSNVNDYKYKLVWIKRHSTNFVHAKNKPMTKHESILCFSKGVIGHASLVGNKRMTYNPQGLVEVNKNVKISKSNFGTIAGHRPSHTSEFLRTHTNYPTDVLFDFPESIGNKKFHTYEKPVALLEYLIKTYSNEGETVLDFTMGSGSTGVACVNTNRQFIGIELDEGYFEIAKQRIEEAKQHQ